MFHLNRRKIQILLSMFCVLFLPSTCSNHVIKSNDGFPEEVQKIVFNSCVNCHAGGLAEGGFGFVDDPKALIDNGYIIPGDASNSPLYQKLTNNPPYGARMPFSGPYLGERDLLAFAKWINSFERTYTVTAAGSHVRIEAPDLQKVTSGSTASFVVSAESGYDLADIVGGDCPAGSWSGNIYSTGPISADCSLSFSTTGNYLVTATGSQNLSISPASPQLVKEGSNQSFTVTASAGYVRSSSVSGTCPQGNWDGDEYTTGKIVENCSVAFTVLGQETVTATGNLVTIDPATPQTVNQGSTLSLTVSPLAVKAALAAGATAAPSYSLAAMVGGTCPAGSWNGPTYTTGPITSTCTVSFSVANPCSTTVASVSFSSDLVPILQNNPVNAANKSCMDCHSTGTTKAVFGAAGSAVYSTLMAATIISNAAVGGSTVVPGDPLNSWLYRKTTSSWLGTSSSSRMPKSGTGFLSTDEQSIICNWILQGALNN